MAKLLLLLSVFLFVGQALPGTIKNKGDQNQNDNIFDKYLAHVKNKQCFTALNEPDIVKMKSFCTSDLEYQLYTDICKTILDKLSSICDKTENNPSKEMFYLNSSFSNMSNVLTSPTKSNKTAIVYCSELCQDQNLLKTLKEVEEINTFCQNRSVCQSFCQIQQDKEKETKTSDLITINPLCTLLNATSYGFKVASGNSNTTSTAALKKNLKKQIIVSQVNKPTDVIENKTKRKDAADAGLETQMKNNDEVNKACCNLEIGYLAFL
jgi:hypothetical protein